MNVALLKRVKARILKEPRQFVMSSYFVDGEQLGEKLPNCGTAACIAGWAIALHERKTPAKAKRKGDDPLYRPLGQMALDLDYFQAQALFYVQHWPREFRDRWYAVNFEGGDWRTIRAQVGADRIDHFIATEGRE